MYIPPNVSFSYELCKRKSRDVPVIYKSKGKVVRTEVLKG